MTKPNPSPLRPSVTGLAGLAGLRAGAALALALLAGQPLLAQAQAQAPDRPLLLAQAPAAASAAAPVAIKDAWVRATVAQQKGTGAFMTLTASSDARLVAAASPISAVVEVHEMAIVNDVMRMRQVDGIALPAGRAVELKPGGYHIMIMDLKSPLQAGDTVPLTLTFEGPGNQRQTVEVKATVRPLTTDAAAGGHGAHSGHAAPALPATPAGGHGGHGSGGKH